VKERLTGAVILVALIVLLVPELLTGPVRSATAPQPAAASAEESPLRSYTIDLADENRSQGASSSAGSPSPQPAAATPGSPEPSTAKPASISEGRQAGGEPTDAEPAATSDPSRLPAPQDKPLEATHGQPPAQEQPAPTPHPRPVETHPRPVEAHPRPVEKAPAPAHHLAAAKPPEAKQPATPSEASSAGSGWVVQLGVFASRANADRLAEELKGKGFKVAVSEIAGNGRKLFRVRSAPLADRGAAQDLAVKLRAAGATGSVVPRT
jgi:DedD protein